MGDDLFSADEITSLSPKGDWMVRHNISTHAPEDDENGVWRAWVGHGLSVTVFTGPTEEAALLKLASRFKLTFYR